VVVLSAADQSKAAAGDATTATNGSEPALTRRAVQAQKVADHVDHR
jgi:hypothetical protein